MRALLAAVVCTFATGASAQGTLKMDVGSNSDAAYAKECGSCHFAYQPAWLPERSWRRLMSGLANHFGENATISASAHQSVLNYLVTNAADKSTNDRSREIMAAIPPNEAPISITAVLYVGGIHGGFLDPAFEGKPAVKTLAHCAACHPRADRGWFYAVNYTISDEKFRSKQPDTAVNMPLPDFMKPK